MLAPSDGLPQAQTDLVLTAVDLSVAAADEAQKGNYETAFELLSCAQRGVECVKAFGTQAFNEASLPIVEKYMQYRHPGFDWHAHYAKESQEQIAQHSDPAVQKAAQFGSAVGKALPHALLTLLSAKTGPGASHPPAAMAPQAAAAGINGATVTVAVAAADGITVAAQAAKTSIALMTDGPQDTNRAGSGQQAPVPQAPAPDKPATQVDTQQDKAAGAKTVAEEGMMCEAEDAAQRAAKASEPHGQAPKAAPSEQGAPSATGQGEAAPPTTQAEGIAKSEAAASKSATAPEKVTPAVKAETGIIRAYSGTHIKRDHIFSDKHKKAGIYKLSKLPETEQVEKMGSIDGKILSKTDSKIREKVQDDILAKFQRIIEAVDAAGKLTDTFKGGVTNVIRTTINGFQVEIRVHITEGQVMNINAFLENSGRPFIYEIYWP